jgi:predicted DNA-binding transcriptional regulator YafY
LILWKGVVCYVYETRASPTYGWNNPQWKSSISCHFFRQFALPRIRAWRILTEELFEPDSNFTPESYFRESFQAEHGDQIVEVVLLFDAYQARYMRERKLHSSQEIEEQPDGSLLMRFKTGALAEVQRQVLSYSKHVKVLAPASFAEAVVDELNETLQLYEGSLY